MLGQRVMAAVVFTDAVGFTRRTGEDEEEAFRLLTDDFSIMRATAHEWHGDVKKSTGDGLLMVFENPVHAVSCSVEIQRKLALRAKGNSRALRHRIGIHFGEVLLSPEDVVGDGVNVANRLQGEAMPGAICFTQPVFDAVKGKIPLRAKPMGERQLKNVSRPVAVYEIPPLLGSAVADRRVAGRPPKSDHKGRSALAGGMVFLGVCVLAAVLIFAFRERLLLGIAASPVRITKVVQKGSNEPHDTGAQRDRPGSTPIDQKQAYAEARTRFGKTYDFDGMLAWLDAQPWINDPASKALRDHWDALRKSREAVLDALGKATETQPLKVGDDSYWLITGTKLGFLPSSGSTSEIELESLKPETFVALAKAVGLDPALLSELSSEYGIA